MEHLKFLRQVLDEDHAEINRKEKTYQGSWKKRGGVGAAMMILRKCDRLEIILKNYDYDIFDACLADVSGADGSALAEIRDLRRYLTLVEAEINASCYEAMQPGTPDDGGHHEKSNEEQESAHRRSTIIADNAAE